jgi:putative FmdB family regulatory protein
MPIHEYACQSCGLQFETLARSSEAPACTSCGSGALDKKPSACGTCGDPRGAGACRLN